MDKRRLIMILILVDTPIIIGVLLWFFVFRPPAQNFRDLPGVSLNEQQTYELARQVGQSERRMWEAYYNQETVTIARELLGVLQVQFGLSMAEATSVAEPLAQAAQSFASSRGDYEEVVLPHLVSAYTQIRDVSRMGFNPREVAAAELAWWVARRTPEQDTPANVGKEIAKLYTALYGVDSGNVQRAGLLRATAAHKRDTNADNPPWDEIEAILTESYIALITAISQGR